MRSWMLPLTLGLALPAASPLILVGCSDGGDSGLSESNCVDELDNDGDGDADCEDADCASTPACLDDTGDTGDTDSGDTGDTGDASVQTLERAVATFYGEEAGDWAGFSMAADADVNGDGVNDLIVGAPNNDCDDENGTELANAGAAYVFFGPLSGQVSVDNADIKICGNRPDAELGRWVGLADDITGDGLGDIIVSAPTDGSGRIFVLSGQPATTEIVRTKDTNPYLAATLTGEDNKYHFGYTFRLGFPDGSRGTPSLLVGSDAWSGSGAATANVGRTYVFSGPVTDTAATRANATFTGIQPGEGSGRDADFGDFNGDGRGDVAIGALRTNVDDLEAPGVVYIKYANVLDTKWDLDDSDAVLKGRSPFEGVGQLVTNAGDFNDDGYDDLMIGAHTAGQENGAAYIFFGSDGGWSGEVATDTADAQLTGGKAYDRTGHGGAGVGDVTADGIDDVVVGAIGIDLDGFSERGAAFLIPGGTTGRVDVDDAATRTWLGVASNELAGHRIGRAGDVTGDGVNDVLVGAYWNSTNANKAGAVYVLAGAWAE